MIEILDSKATEIIRSYLNATALIYTETPTAQDLKTSLNGQLQALLELRAYVVELAEFVSGPLNQETAFRSIRCSILTGILAELERRTSELLKHLTKIIQDKSPTP